MYAPGCRAVAPHPAALPGKRCPVYLPANAAPPLFDDAGFDGAVIDMYAACPGKLRPSDTDAVRITARAERTLGQLCNKARLGLTGLEFACIPPVRWAVAV